MKFLFFIAILILSVGCRRGPSGTADPQEIYMSQFKAFCGNSYRGETVFPKGGKDPFAGKQLTLHFRECGRRENRLQFQVGDDLSRTWVLTNTRQGLQLKHDHRKPDGTPDEVTMYGGTAQEGGTGRSQSFPADEHTAKLIPAGKNNIWTIEFSANKEILSYTLKRDGNLRYQANFNLMQPLAKK
ncbi:hypothetical protein BH24BAC1_BH24BAC1_13430 [soil metagenome]